MGHVKSLGNERSKNYLGKGMGPDNYLDKGIGYENQLEAREWAMKYI